MTAARTGFGSLDRVLEEDAGFLEILEDRTTSAELVAEFLRTRGFKVSASTIRTFRRTQERKGNLDSH